MEKNTIMKTNYIPAIIMLLAGFLYCIIGIKNKVEVTDFCIQLIIVLLVFYILGGIIKMVLDAFMKKPELPKEEDIETLFGESFVEDDRMETENIHTEESDTM